MARIAHFIDTWESGGAERVLVDLCTHLPKHGHTLETHHLGNQWIVGQCERRGLACVELPREPWYRSKWSVGAFAFRYARELRRREIELLHSHLVGPVSAGAVAARLAGIPHVGTLHDVFHITEDPKRLHLVRLAARLGTRLVVVSEQMRRFFRERTKNSVEFTRIYNGIECDAFGRPSKPRNGAFTFLSVGRLVELKGHDTTLRALATPAAKSYRLRILGDGPSRDSLERLAASLGVEERVEFLGFREDVESVLAEADAFVLASRSEGLSCSIMEAMAAGLPCIVTDVGGNSELVADGGNGYLVAPDLPEALAERMQRLANDRPQARAMGNTSRERVAQLFSMDATLSQYHELYQSLLPARGARSLYQAK